jgi:hypothetical protein
MQIKHTSLILLVLFFATSTFISTTASAKIYKWVDEDGQTHFSDEPPTNKSIDSTEIAVTPPVNSSSSEDTLKEFTTKAEQDSIRRNHKWADESAQREAKKRAGKERSQSCTAARKQYDVLSQKVPVYRDNTGKLKVRWSNDPYAGTMIFIEDDERKQLINETVDAVYQLCDNPENHEAQREAVAEQTMDEDCEMALARLERAKTPSKNTSKRTRNDEIKKWQKNADAICDQ